MKIVIRHIEEKDYQKTIGTIIDSIKGSFPKIRPEELMPYFCEKYSYDKFVDRAKSITMFVASDSRNEEIYGVIGLKGNELRTFYVKTSYQRKGIGRLLYERLEQEAKEQGITKLTLEGSPFGEPAYVKFGFVKLGEKDKEKCNYRYSDAVMEKVL